MPEQEHRDTGEQAPVQANGWWKKALLAVLGLFVAGIAGGLITWGGLSTTVEAQGKRQDRFEMLQLQDGRDLTTVKAQLVVVLKTQQEAAVAREALRKEQKEDREKMEKRLLRAIYRRLPQ